MRLVIIGCEYSGTTTLSQAINQWTKKVIGEQVGFHDHWKFPHVSHPNFGSPDEAEKGWADWAAGKTEDPTRLGFSEKEQELLLALTPNQKEMFNRYHMEYHMSPSFYSYDHHSVVGMHIDEAVYAKMYYGYGGDGEYAARKELARHYEEQMLDRGPDTVLVLCQVSPNVIRRRMKENPHKNGLVQEKDIQLVVGRFEEEYEKSLLKNKFTVDTGTKTVDESLAEFVEKIEEFITDADRLKILVHRAKQSGDFV